MTEALRDSRAHVSGDQIRSGAEDTVPGWRPTSVTTRQLWLANWSDREDADFRWAWAQEGLDVEVARSRHLGSSVPQSLRRAYAWPGYAGMAVEGLRRSGELPHSTLVAWQAIAGGIAAMRPRSRAERERLRIIAMNPHPLQSERPPTRRQQLMIAMMRRADAVVFFSRCAVDQAIDLGLDPGRCHFIPLGVRPRREAATEPGRYLFAIGRSHRDWATLAAAAERAGVDVLVSGPEELPDSPRLHRVDAPTKSAYLSLVDGARAIVIPLRDGSRQAGHLAILDALSLGRAVITNAVPALDEYVTDATGAVVGCGDVAALAGALTRLSEPAAAAAAGRAALDRARSDLNLRTFVTAVGRLAESVWDQPAA
jgi:hypothetical protein